jgi:AbrB family looped-hinge helix DNA binding protein
MPPITISSGFRIVIPRQIRESLKLKPGQKLQAIQYENRIEFVPLRSAKSMRGFVRGIDTGVARDRNRI